MRRIQIVMTDELDDLLEREAATRGTSKSALVRSCLERWLPADQSDNGLLAIGALAPSFADVEPADIDTVLYGPLEAES